MTTEQVRERLGADIVTSRGRTWKAQWRTSGDVLPQRYTDAVLLEFDAAAVQSVRVANRKSGGNEWAVRKVVTVIWRM